MATLLKALPAASDVHYAAGVVAIARNDTVGARRAFTRAHELDPNNLEAVSGLVRLDFKERRPDTAKARVDQQLARTPDLAAAMGLAARVYATTGDAGAQRGATPEGDRERSGEPARLRHARRSCTSPRRRLADARANFERVLKEQPASTSLGTIVAILYQMEGKRDEAKRRYEHVMQTPIRARPWPPTTSPTCTRRTEAISISRSSSRRLPEQKLPDEAEVTDTLGWIYVKKDLADRPCAISKRRVAKQPEKRHATVPPRRRAREGR